MSDDGPRKRDLFDAGPHAPPITAEAEPPPTPPTRAPAPVVPVSRFVASARLLLERHLGLAWISGEVSGCTRAPSGHLYFTLKDDAAQVRCVFFRHKAQRLPFTLREGLAVEVRATPSIYEPRGEFQLNVETMRLAGLGALYERFLQRKNALAAAGLFDEARKRALPAFPRRIGVVTSRRAAALRDVLTTLSRCAGRRVPRLRAGRGCCRRDRDGDPPGKHSRPRRRADRLPRRRLARGPVGVQRGDRRARRLRVAPADRIGCRARNGFHDLRLRRRRARGNADSRGGAGRARSRGAAPRRSGIGAALRACPRARGVEPRAAARRRCAPPRAPGGPACAAGGADAATRAQADARVRAPP